MRPRKEGLFRYRQWLMKAYHEQGLSIRKIARICDVNERTIFNYLKEYGIETTRVQAGNMEGVHFYFPRHVVNSLRNLSKIKGQSMSAIAREVLTDYMLRNKFNPFSESEFKDKNV